jgi:succinate dehydrogenase flavin-adding protein (antitoxin of CptAB toxin-antitoxin module)
MFGEKHLRKLSGDWDTKLSKFMETKDKVLDDWHFGGSAYFKDIYWDLFNDLNKKRTSTTY